MFKRGDKVQFSRYGIRGLTGYVRDVRSTGHVLVEWSNRETSWEYTSNLVKLTENRLDRIAGKITHYPHRTQGFSYDCGATAVLTVLQYYGFNNDRINQQSVHEAIGTDQDGTSNDGIEEGLRKLGMSFQKVSTPQEIDQHVNDGHPVLVCLAQWIEQGKPVWHYAVVTAREEDRYIISDPWSVNMVWVSLDIFEKIWIDQPDEPGRWGVAVLGESKYREEVIPMDVKLAGCFCRRVR
jgi:hypothetical protein